ncbi:Membrane protein involved in the export of O-antigen and teichoic acid [Kytococcus aerolatus]|uniref:Membrane protein involved in the export of O-antigen and teichoic acid n=1 Tax=Kytococcus aerolatus TaxID=592308 RepID=A0A212T6R6_9MICO|nr:lipopolysaccharide biosynthesis protein [Kytococcus aerolatus]SNC61747.1 Membrane protein involved in the export of O-antigen and teichoic acid [Kytococcus aerolatus]
MAEAGSRRSAFAWNFAGTTLYNFSQWLVLAILGRLFSQATVGEYSLLLALTAPVFLLTGLNLRVIQATDARRRWSVSQFERMRHLLNAVAMGISFLIGVFTFTDMGLLAALVAVCGAKAVEARGQLNYGYFQVHDRLDYVAQSLLSRALLGPMMVALAAFLTDSLAWSAVGLMVGWVIPQLLLDKPRVQRLIRNDPQATRPEEPRTVPALRAMLTKGFPLGVDAGVSSLSINAPRYLLQATAGSAALGGFVPLAYLAQLISSITSAMATTLISPMSRAYHEGRRKYFVRSLVRLVAFGAGVSAAAMVAAWAIGDWVIARALGPEYVNRPLLMALLLSSTVITLQRMLSKALEASTAFTRYMLVDSVTLATVALASVVLIPKFGALGAAHSLTMGFLLGTAVVLAMVVKLVNTMPDSPASRD